ncbi:protein scribble homolog isoform X3 [Corticium candelabrum]|uniref:protein scribble homolog isoform X3 n=1 Tax=Corticium candelabrum TaxID=121492 RepID=UPI002E260CC1|nr:protein scribble homolog isoform X3 [Corticium candelabrum]
MFRACAGFLGRRVESIDRRHSSLIYIPDDILRHHRSLQELLLDSNQIQDLPKAFFQLQRLLKLGLSDNAIVQLPNDVGRLTALVELDISKNGLEELPESIKFCKSLSVFDCSSNPLSKLPEGFTQLTALTQLCVNDNSLSFLPTEIGRLTKLESLEARDNMIRYLPNSINFLESLERLDLGGNELEELPASISCLARLEELWLDSNELKSIPVEVGSLKKLWCLDLSENKLEVVPDEIEGLQALTSLYLTQNNLERLPDSVGKLKKLELLKADYNRLSELTPAIGNLTILSELMLLDNLLETLPPEIGRLKNLNSLNVDHNRLVALPPEISNCQNLRILSLRDNVLARLPNTLGYLVELKVLDVVNNRLSSFPASFEDLPVSAIWMAENQTKSKIPLHEETDPTTGETVLTCFLLPQESLSCSKENLLLDDGASSVLAEHSSASASATQSGNVAAVDFITPEKKNDKDFHPQVDVKLQRKPTPHPKDLKDAKTRYVKSKHRVRNMNAELFSSMDNPAVDRLSNNSYDSGKLKPADAGSYGSSGSIDKRSRSGKENDLKEQKEQNALPEAVATVMVAQVQHSALPMMFDEVSSLKKEEEPSEQLPDESQDTKESKSVSFNAVAESDSRKKFNRRETPFPGKLLAVDAVEDVSEDVQGAAENDTLPSQENGMKRVDTPFEFPVVQGTVSSPPREIGIGEEEEAVPSEEQVVEPVVDALVELSKAASEGSVGRRDVKSFPIRAKLIRSPGESYGLRIAGGTDMERAFDGFDDGIYITVINEGGLADRDGQLKVGDKIIEVNGIDLSNATHEVAVNALKSASSVCDITVLRRVIPVSSSPPPELDGQVPYANTTEAVELSSVEVKSAESEEPSQSFEISEKFASEPDVETVVIAKAGGPLGMSIIGGVDQPSGPFGKADDPGIFVSKVTYGGKAHQSGKISIGDRLLVVNGVDLQRATHDVAVQSLKLDVKEVVMLVKREPKPTGHEVICIIKTEGEKLGISIKGGVGSQPGNPYDTKDEGVFVSKVNTGGAAEKCRQLRVGQRIISVNGTSLVGVTHNDAVRVMRTVGNTLTIVVCDGYDPVGNERPTSAEVHSLSPVPVQAVTQSTAAPTHSPSEAQEGTVWLVGVSAEPSVVEESVKTSEQNAAPQQFAAPDQNAAPQQFAVPQQVAVPQQFAAPELSAMKESEDSERILAEEQRKLEEAAAELEALGLMELSDEAVVLESPDLLQEALPQPPKEESPQLLEELLLQSLKEISPQPADTLQEATTVTEPVAKPVAKPVVKLVSGHPVADADALALFADSLQQTGVETESLGSFGEEWQRSVSGDMAQRQISMDVNESQSVHRPVQETFGVHAVSQVESTPPPLTQQEMDAEYRELLSFADTWAAEAVQAGAERVREHAIATSSRHTTQSPTSSEGETSLKNVKALRQHFEEAARPSSLPSINRRSMSSGGSSVTSPTGTGKFTVQVSPRGKGPETMSRGQELFKAAEERLRALTDMSGDTLEEAPKATANVRPLVSVEDRKSEKVSSESTGTARITVSSRSNSETKSASSGVSKVLTDKEWRAQEARARVEARIHSRQSKSPSPATATVGAVAMSAQVIADAPPAVEAPQSGVPESGKRADWRQQRKASLEKQGDRALDAIERVKTISTTAPEKSDKAVRKTSEVKVVLTSTSKPVSSDELVETKRKGLTVTVQSVARDSKSPTRSTHSSSEERTGSAHNTSDSSEVADNQGEEGSQKSTGQSRGRGGKQSGGGKRRKSGRGGNRH